LPSLEALLSEQKKALEILNSQHATGADLVKLDKQRADLAKQIATTEREIATTQKNAEKAKVDAAKKAAKAKLDAEKQASYAQAEKILGLNQSHRSQTAQQSLTSDERKVLIEALVAAEEGAGGVPGLRRRRTPKVGKNFGFGGLLKFTGSGLSKGEADKLTAQLQNLPTGKLLALLGDEFGPLPKATSDSLDKINEVLKLKFLPPDVVENIRQRLEQIKTSLLSTVSAMNQASTQIPQTSSRVLTAGLGLTQAQRQALEFRYSDALAHGGAMTPQGSYGLNGVYINTVQVSGVTDVKSLANELTKHAKRNSGQTRGTRGGSYLGHH
jgi:multidrug efflux pump subunit AcrA (membrane-fusion protein)